MNRDFIGYGQEGLNFKWPQEAHVALSFVINYEEGSEHSILDGDEEAESLFVDIPGIKTSPGKRHLSSESIFEYGSRAGIWRLLKLFDEYKILTTIFAAGLALERHPPLCQYLRENHHELAGHGFRWIDYQSIPCEVEKEHMIKTIHLIQTLTGKDVYGWYTGRVSEQTRALLAETPIIYDSQSYSDDLPFWISNQHKPLLIIPYSLDCNDIRYCTSPGWSSAEDEFQYLKHTFDCLYREGVRRPKMMSIGLHPRISGRPARAEALRRFLDYIHDKNVWICRRQDIATFWMAQFPFA
jgi:allantoinase